MDSTRYRMSIEELAYAMGVLGGREAATAFLLALLGERGQAEVEGRLMAAAHSLVARGWLNADLTSGALSLAHDFAAVVRPLLQHRWQLRCSRLTAQGDDTWSYYPAANGQIVEHVLVHEITTELEALADQNVMLARLARQYGVPAAGPAAQVTQICDAFAIGALQQARDLAAENMDAAASVLEQAGLSRYDARELANDLIHPEERGSVVRLDGDDPEADASEGLLFLKSTNLCWYFHLSPARPEFATVERGSASGLVRCVQSMLSLA